MAPPCLPLMCFLHFYYLFEYFVQFVIIIFTPSPQLLEDAYPFTIHISLVCLDFFFKHQVQFVIPWYLWICAFSLEYGWPTGHHTFEENWVSLSQQLSIANSTSVWDFMPLTMSTMRLCLAWVCACHVHAVSTTVSATNVRLSCCVWKNAISLKSSTTSWS